MQENPITEVDSAKEATEVDSAEEVAEVYSAEELARKEQQLKERLGRILELEKEVQKKEKSLKESERTKKQLLLRLSPSLWNDIAQWAEEDFRSINGQIEYLLSACVRERKKKKF